MEFLDFIQKERSWNRNNPKPLIEENIQSNFYKSAIILIIFHNKFSSESNWFLGVEYNTNDESADNKLEDKKTNLNLEKIMKMNYNYICCIDSRKKPDIYIGGKINLPAKNYRFSDTNRKILEENQKIKKDLIIEENDLSSENLGYKVTDSIKKSKNYSQDVNEDNSKTIDFNKLEEVEKQNSFVDNNEELRKIGKSYDSDADAEGKSFLNILLLPKYIFISLIDFFFTFFKNLLTL